MKMTILILSLLLICCSPLCAEIKDQNAVFTLMCISEKSTGFNWYQGAWSYAKFKEEKFLIEKVKPEDVCKMQLDEKNVGESYKYFRAAGFAFGCYNQRLFGGPFYSFQTQLCSEYWKITGTEHVLQQVTCENLLNPISFAPDGWFHRASIHNDVQNKPTKDYKDSLTIEVGKCAVISK